MTRDRLIPLAPPPDPPAAPVVQGALGALVILLACACGDPATAETPAAPTRTGSKGEASPTMPVPRVGADVLGRPVAQLLPERRFGGHVEPSAPTAAATPAGTPTAIPDATPAATLVRFWTDTCAFCRSSLPALETLRSDFGQDGLETLAVYHPKPPRPTDEQDVIDAARARGYHGPLALDPDWSSLQAIWLDGERRAATSASFLLDREGRVRYVHPGPEFFPSDDPEHAGADGDYRQLRAAIEALLAG